MTNDNLPITNAEVADAAAWLELVELNPVLDEEGNLIPNPTQEQWEAFTQADKDVSLEVLDASNTSH